MYASGSRGLGHAVAFVRQMVVIEPIPSFPEASKH